MESFEYSLTSAGITWEYLWVMESLVWVLSHEYKNLVTRDTRLYKTFEWKQFGRFSHVRNIAYKTPSLQETCFPVSLNVSFNKVLLYWNHWWVLTRYRWVYLWALTRMHRSHFWALTREYWNHLRVVTHLRIYMFLGWDVLMRARSFESVQSCAAICAYTPHVF